MHSNERAKHQNIVLRMLNGKMKKCSVYTHFSAAYKHIKVVTVDGELETVDINDVKAIFFVKDFAGNPEYKAHQDTVRDSPKAGKIVKVTFQDGESLRGRVLNPARGRRGFFLFPMDPADNNEKVYVVRSPGIKIEAEE